MPAFNFYQRAYKVNQSSGITSFTFPPSNITMGDTGTSVGLAWFVYATLYADFISADSNRDMYTGATASYYMNYFLNSPTPNNNRASYLEYTDVGPAVPWANNSSCFTWDRPCRPSALGDIRDNEKYNNLRDGAWVEAGYNGTDNYISIYSVNPSGGAPYYINSITTNLAAVCGFNSTPLTCRVFTYPSLMSDFVPSISSVIGGGYVLIAYFAWDNSTKQLYYELFTWNPNINVLSSWNSGVILSFYDEFLYSGKHDMFTLHPWSSVQNYASNDNMLIFGPGAVSGVPRAYEIDISSGALIANPRANAGGYVDQRDIIYLSDDKFILTYLTTLSSTVVDSFALPGGHNIFDADYNYRIADDVFYFGDDQGSSIKGWAVRFNPSGLFTSVGAPYGVTSDTCTITGGSISSLKRVVTVAPMQIVVGPGPNWSTQVITRVMAKNNFYKGGSTIDYDSTSVHEDFCEMNHGFCEDYFNFFDSGGYYTSGYATGLEVGKGNQHIITVTFNVDVNLFSKNLGNQYQTNPMTATTYGGHYNYIIYLGKAAFSSSNTGNHTGDAYFYIGLAAGSGTNDFELPTILIQGTPATFTFATGALNQIAFYC